VEHSPYSTAAEGDWPPGTFMARLTAASRADLVGLASPRTFPAGSVLIMQGETRNHVQLLRSARMGGSACVKVTATAENGSESLLGIRVSGDIVGELAVLRGTGRSATVTTCTETVVHTIPGRAFVGFLHTHTDGWEALCRMLADRLDWANRRRVDFGGYSVPSRLARVLLELVEHHGHPVRRGHGLGVSLSQTELGELIGAKPDAVGLALRELRASGLVISGYRRLTVTDLDGLRQYVDRT
jgi:CRP/FNR family transcriptional regulator, cyclic AMP receptor protein